MATVSSHLLNGVDGSHAADVNVLLYKIAAGNRTLVFDSQTDSGGRLHELVNDENLDIEASYELQIDTGNYWQTHGLTQYSANTCANVCEEIVFRFRMPEKNARYHMPFIISPNNYSVWWSAPENIPGDVSAN